MAEDTYNDMIAREWAKVKPENNFKGFMGIPPDKFTREELVMMLDILNNSYEHLSKLYYSLTIK